MSTAHFQKLPQAYKFMIGSIPEEHNDEITVEAQFNPKELQIESPIGWAEHKAISAQSVATKPMEFTGMGAETIKVELVFDAFEDDSDLVVQQIKRLKQMASVREPHSSNTKDPNQRPSYCVATWGTQAPFRCVIEAISVKYTMFGFDGTPVRASVTLSLKSGCRPLGSSGETDFERASSRKLEAQRDRLQKERDARFQRNEAERRIDERERRRAEETRYQASAADRSLAEREERVSQEQRELQAKRDQRQREIDQRADRSEREQRVGDAERQVAADREAERMREQRKNDLDLE